MSFVTQCIDNGEVSQGSAQDSRVTRGLLRQRESMRADQAGGARLVGWKAGFGAPPVQAQLRLGAPLVGYLINRAIVPSGEQVRLTGWTRPVAEPEIAIYVDRDLSGDVDRATAKTAISALGPAFELADVDGPTDDVEAILAANVFQRRVVLGQPDAALAGARVRGIEVAVLKSGAPIDVPADLQANTGDLVDILCHVARVAAANGERLRAGQFVIAGSIVAPLYLEGDTQDQLVFRLGSTEVAAMVDVRSH